MTVPDDADALKQRLDFLDAILVAVDRRNEVIEIVAKSESADDARASLCTLLNISDMSATAILDLQIRRLAKREKARLIEDRDAVGRQLVHDSTTRKP